MFDKEKKSRQMSGGSSAFDLQCTCARKSIYDKCTRKMSTWIFSYVSAIASTSGVKNSTPNGRLLAVYKVVFFMKISFTIAKSTTPKSRLLQFTANHCNGAYIQIGKALNYITLVSLINNF